MKRRDVLKVAVASVVGMSIGVQANEAYKNRNEMMAKDSKNMTKGELKHSPLITIKEKDAKGYTLVEITVGQKGIIHPSTQNHWIDFIELYADDKLVGRANLEAEISRGLAHFSVKLDGVKNIKSKAGCNLHGIWTTIISL